MRSRSFGSPSKGTKGTEGGSCGCLLAPSFEKGRVDQRLRSSEEGFGEQRESKVPVHAWPLASGSLDMQQKQCKCMQSSMPMCSCQAQAGVSPAVQAAPASRATSKRPVRQPLVATILKTCMHYRQLMLVTSRLVMGV